jgi:hypothetical protein
MKSDIAKRPQNTSFVEKRGWSLTPSTKLEVKHDQFPENEIIINAVWCDIGGHKVYEDEMRYGPYDASICFDCYDHFTE